MYIIAWGDSGKSRHATPHAHQHEPLARARAASDPQVLRMHARARGSTPHPRRRHQRTNTNSNNQTTTQGGRAGTRRTAMPSKGFAPTQQDCRRATDLQFSASFQKEDRIGLPSSDPETPPHPIRMLPHPIQSEASRSWKQWSGATRLLPTPARASSSSPTHLGSGLSLAGEEPRTGNRDRHFSIPVLTSVIIVLLNPHSV